MPLQHLNQQSKKRDPVDTKKTSTPDPHKDHFGQFANTCSAYMGSRWAFAVAVGIIVVWAISGPIYHYSDTWQLVINTGTTIVTFLMVFLIQNTQNRDTTVIQLKLDELIRANERARDRLMSLENLDENEIRRLKSQIHDERKPL
jgi:low affinity Fe/Cu permease